MLKNNTTVLIMDNGEPSFVILNYDTYKNMSLENGAAPANGAVPISNVIKTPAATPGEVELLERINKDILALKAEIEKEEQALGETVE